jgi:hypothetical protein
VLCDPLKSVVAAADTASSTPIGRRENKIEVKSSKRLEYTQNRTPRQVGDSAGQVHRAIRSLGCLAFQTAGHQRLP